MITGFAKGRPSVEPTAKALLRLHYLVSDLHVPGKYGPTAGCSFGHLSGQTFVHQTLLSGHCPESLHTSALVYLPVRTQSWTPVRTLSDRHSFQPISLESSNSGSPPTRARAGALVTHQRGAHPAPPSRGCEWVVKGDPRLLAYGSQPAFGISFPLTCIYFLVNAQHEIHTRYCPIPRFTHKTQKTFII